MHTRDPGGGDVSVQVTGCNMGTLCGEADSQEVRRVWGLLWGTGTLHLSLSFALNFKQL